MSLLKLSFAFVSMSMPLLGMIMLFSSFLTNQAINPKSICRRERWFVLTPAPREHCAVTIVIISVAAGGYDGYDTLSSVEVKHYIILQYRYRMRKPFNISRMS
jgi:hypothetical protein